MPLNTSPLFQEASRQVQAAARRQFRSSDLGRLLAECQAAVGSAGHPERAVDQMLRRFSRAASPDNVLRQMMGAEFGDVVRAVQRYSRPGASQRLVNQFLDTLGPAGHLIRSLVDPSKRTGLTAELKSAMGLIRAFGGEVIPGSGEHWGSVEDVERGVRAMIQRLEAYGFQVASSLGPPRRVVQAEEGRKTVDVEMGYRRGTARVRSDHPMVTGDMVQTPHSTNVYEIGYDLPNGLLYVRFQAPHEEGTHGGPGPLYQYSGVTPEEFLALYRVRNQGGGNGPGAWVWDVLRVRGTVSGHHKDYKLVGIMGNYVPRKATSRPIYETLGARGQRLKHPKKVGMEEWYEQRHVKTHEGRWARSVLPTTRVTSTRGPR